MASLSTNVSEPTSLLAVVGGVERLIRDCCSSSGDDLLDAWEIASVRLKGLQRSLRSVAAMQLIDDRLIQLGLVGPEMDFRSNLFASLCGRACAGPVGEQGRADVSDMQGAIRIASSVFQTMSRIELFGDDAEALAGLLDAVLVEGLIQASIRRT